MKNYESPVVIMNDELAEGIFATGGSGINYEDDPTCWTLTHEKYQVISHEGKARFRFYANHPGTVAHISTKSTIVITFSEPVEVVECQGFKATVSGCVVTFERENHANSYYSADQYSVDIMVKAANADAVSVTSATITCTHAVNVQGGFD